MAFTLLVILLTYGGVSGLVSIFLVWPIAVNLARESNKSKTLFFIMFFFGFLTLAYTMLPGTPQLSNVLAAEMLGTTPTAAPILSIIASVITFAMGYGYLIWLDKHFVLEGVRGSFKFRFLQMVNINRFFCRINNPVFFYSGIHVKV